MLDIRFIRDNPEKVKEGLTKRGVVFDTQSILRMDTGRRQKIKEVDDLRAILNKSSKEISGLHGSIKEQKIKAVSSWKDKLSVAEKALEDLECQFTEALYDLPNLPLADVPVGKEEGENKVVRKWGKIPKFSFAPRDHVELGESLDIIDIERAGKVVGARFGYFKREAVLLEFALAQFTFAVLASSRIVKKLASSVSKNYSDRPFVPVVPPVMIRPEVLKKMARLSEQDKEERYYLPKDDLYLVGSAEHTLGPMHMDEILDEKDLPIRYIGFSTSFRREAGSYGKDTRGMLRVHQFDKLEMESFTLPEDSVKEQNFIVAIQEFLVRSLKIPYQVVMICTGDMGKPDARQIDIECWIPSQKRYRETHTSDLMTDYQTRRLNTRVRRKNGKIELAHTNDATAFAIGRILIAILENYQQKDGSVKIPKVLQPYMHGIKKIG